MHRSTIIRTTAAAFVAAALTLAACGGSDDEAGSPSTAATAATAGSATGENEITIESFEFGGVASVPAGTTVTVTNNDTAPHTVTADDGSFDTGTIQPGRSAEITVDAAGTIAFHCNIHPSMAGSITVTA